MPHENERKLPITFVDAHHHFIDTSAPFHGFLAFHLGSGQRYSLTDYRRDVIDPILGSGIEFGGSVHVEAIPDDGLAEVEWVMSSLFEGETFATFPGVKAIVASCDLTRPSEVVRSKLGQFQQKCPLVRGIRWILDVGEESDQEYISGTATHIATTRHSVEEFGTIDYLKVSAFENGFSCLQHYDFSFDLQCSPSQLSRAAGLLKKYPNIPVCVDHLGKLRQVSIDDGLEDDKQLDLWKHGMQQIAQAHENVYCKLSMLGCLIPGWHNSPRGQDVLKKLLRWVIMDWFGPRRCMVALNWHFNASVSDSDGFFSSGPSPIEWIELVSSLLPGELSAEQINDIFANNARRFYRFAT